MGWRGESVSVLGLDNLTFWSRKNAPERIVHSGVTEVLSKLELLKRTKDSMVPGGSLPNKTSATRLVVVGHSFGGAIVHSLLVNFQVPTATNVC
ncbi:hypothetical protein EBAPG3_014035 [Nitrosospira lacus]|uniref:Uncharacterized protein n=1 Tax=Nitrosospira lacus TaxID=1288494 RepID=A0A1W6SSM3_9PROT|nr:hypothetical protein [Nitrosospira lacus]ARO88797.1 hypothetical protein EBAPG3_014035 [Nitrosospira lacus]